MDKDNKMWNRAKIKTVFSHFALLGTVTVYTIVGAIIFRLMEQPAEQSRLRNYIIDVETQRERFLTWRLCQEAPAECTDYLDTYTETLISACKGGVRFPINDSDIGSKWTFPQAAFFATTVLTTIGYGNVVPETFGGRLFCIFFAIIGIPLTLTVIANMGVVLATAVSLLHEKVKACTPNTMAIGITVTASASRWLTALGGISFLIIYMAAGAWLFVALNHDWGVFEGFYFCFITMTTIGFGDLVPGSTNYMEFYILYILMGLSLTSTIIELVRRQYAQSWKTIQALTGPLAESLKRLGETAGTGIDVSIFQNDLKKLLMLVNTSGKSETPAEWQAAVDGILKEMESNAAPKKKPGMIQIIIYESSV